jgi:2-polyprenyl-6-methoxyphenol hydroxylase-like FAD-dependent oxidoreductase
MTMKVLISGASLAGPALAYWLNRRGFEVTVVERGLRPRPGGAPIDVRGAAVDVAERMGIWPEIQAVRTHTEGVAFVDAAGRRRAKFATETLAEEAGRDVELERGDLVNILCDATKDDVEYVFDDSVERLEQDEAGVDVVFAGGGERRFDFVFGADGLHSSVRRLAFGEESRFTRHLGMYVALVDVDPGLGKENWGVMHNSPGKLAGVYSYRGKSTGTLMFRSPALDYDYRDLGQQKKILLDVFEGESWRVPALLDAVRTADDLYFDSVSQVRMPSWSRGRVALVGDAGYCAALLSGMGTTLAMVGADLVAEELAATPDDHRRAFARYEERHRPLVSRSQESAGAGASVLIPPTKFAIWRRNQLSHLLPLILSVRRLMSARLRR